MEQGEPKVFRLRPVTKPKPTPKQKLVKYRGRDGKERERKPRTKPNRKTFGPWLKRLNPPAKGQEVYWDTGTKGQLGLQLLVSAGGTKTYRASFNLHGQAAAVKLGRVGELGLEEARDLTRKYRGMADKGIDPRVVKKEQRQKAREAAIEARENTYEAIVKQFIELYAKPRQRSWAETQRILKKNCAVWLHRPITSITKQDAYKLLDGFIADGHSRKAEVTLAWLRTLWTWAWKRDYVTAPMMDAVEIHVQKNVRDRVFSDDEIKAVWQAADKLDKSEAAYFKLLILLAPRKSALAKMRLIHLDRTDEPTLWTTPTNLTKTKKSAEYRKRVYLTPLPALAQRIIRPLLKRDDRTDDLVFPGHRQRNSGILDPGTALKDRLVEQGAPADFTYHTARHTVTTWLENQGHSEWERGLVLNHAGAGVTAGYSHGNPLDLKRQLLTKWSDHVEKLVTPAGVARLR